MTGKVKNWHRMLVVRKAQAQAAIADAVSAQTAESNLVSNSERLRRLRQMSLQISDCKDGSALHAQLEMGNRLLRADHDINVALGQARQAVAAAERQRTAAFIRRETASKLLDKAITAREARLEQKAQQIPLRRRPKKGNFA